MLIGLTHTFDIMYICSYKGTYLMSNGFFYKWIFVLVQNMNVLGIKLMIVIIKDLNNNNITLHSVRTFRITYGSKEFCIVCIKYFYNLGSNSYLSNYSVVGPRIRKTQV